MSGVDGRAADGGGPAVGRGGDGRGPADRDGPAVERGGEGRGPAESGAAVERGLAVAGSMVEAAVEALGSDLEAAFLIGSLAHGGFAAGISDVDVALVVAVADDATGERIAAARRAAVARASDPLADRLSIFWTSWDALRDSGDAGRFPPLDRHDLLADGVLVRGEDRRAGIAGPSAEQLRTQNADRARDLLAAGPPPLTPGVPRATTKAVLGPVRALFTAVHARPAGNDEAVAWYVGRPDARAGELVAAAHRLRVHGGSDDEVLARAAQLIGLFEELRERLGG